MLWQMSEQRRQWPAEIVGQVAFGPMELAWLEYYHRRKIAVAVGPEVAVDSVDQDDHLRPLVLAERKVVPAFQRVLATEPSPVLAAAE